MVGLVDLLWVWRAYLGVVQERCRIRTAAGRTPREIHSARGPAVTVFGHAQAGCRSAQSKKLACVETTIGYFGMEDFADAVVGVPGKGLNPEQRKRVSISVSFRNEVDLIARKGRRTGVTL